jgi:hypothetical protein
MGSIQTSPLRLPKCPYHLPVNTVSLAGAHHKRMLELPLQLYTMYHDVVRCV